MTGLYTQYCFVYSLLSVYVTVGRLIRLLLLCCGHSPLSFKEAKANCRTFTKKYRSSDDTGCLYMKTSNMAAILHIFKTLYFRSVYMCMKFE